MGEKQSERNTKARLTFAQKHADDPQAFLLTDESEGELHGVKLVVAR